MPREREREIRKGEWEEGGRGTRGRHEKKGER